MLRVFNCGIGMAVIVAAADAAAAAEQLAQAGETVTRIGSIVAAAGSPSVIIEPPPGWPA
jgi:phosphoribosylformylglycinamidine cyclo-ligase